MFQAFVLCFLSLCAVSFGSNGGSTPHLKDIVLGRCWEYQHLKFNASSAKNCSKIWDVFHKAFAYKKPCNTTSDDYKPFFDDVGMDEVKPNKSLFWSGTYKHAHVLADFDTRFTTLEDTMAGWMLNGLNWCESPINSSDGIDYTSCPHSNATSCAYISAFWGQASRKFAETARGTVRVMVNGTRSRDGKPIPAYSKQSFFGNQELPNLQVDKILELIVIVVHSIDGPDLENCSNGSIKLLQDDAKKRGIKTKCYDDPDIVRHLLCADHPTSRECLFLGKAGRTGDRTVTRYLAQAGGPWKIAAITMSSIVAFCLVVAVISIVYIKCTKYNKPPYSNMDGSKVSL